MAANITKIEIYDIHDLEKYFSNGILQAVRSQMTNFGEYRYVSDDGKRTYMYLSRNHFRYGRDGCWQKKKQCKKITSTKWGENDEGGRATNTF